MSHFNKRHYEAIAKVMQSTHGHNWETIRLELSFMFREDNPNYDADRFMHACKPGSNVKARTAHLKVA